MTGREDDEIRLFYTKYFSSDNHGLQCKKNVTISCPLVLDRIALKFKLFEVWSIAVDQREHGATSQKSARMVGAKVLREQ